MASNDAVFLLAALYRKTFSISLFIDILPISRLLINIALTTILNLLLASLPTTFENYCLFVRPKEVYRRSLTYFDMRRNPFSNHK